MVPAIFSIVHNHLSHEFGNLTPGSASKGGSIHQKQPPANVTIAFSFLLSEASAVIVNSKCKNGYKIELASCVRRLLFVCLENKRRDVVAISLTGRRRSIIENMAVMAFTDKTMVFDARTES